MTYEETRAELLKLTGHPVLVQVQEAEGAGEVVAWFSGLLRVADIEGEGTEDELLSFTVGETGVFRVDRLLFDETAPHLFSELCVKHSTVLVLIDEAS
jgi:hypothetical protein